MPTRVLDPHGNEWNVRRKWVHWKIRWRGKGSHALDFVDGADLASLGSDLPGIGMVFIAIGLFLFAIAAVVFIVPALIFLAELLIVLAIVGVGLAGRTLFGRPWTVQARQSGSTDAFEWKTQGWHASRELVRSVADQLQATGVPTGGERVQVG